MSIRLGTSKATKIHLECRQLRSLPIEQNLIFRAAEAFAKEVGLNFEARISLQKRVPMGAGLGGGSSNAAQTLKILSAWVSQSPSGILISKTRLASLAKRLGADVAFFLEEGPAWCTGIGEKCRGIRMNSWPVVIAYSTIKVPTSWAYRELDNFRQKSQRKNLLLLDSRIPKWVSESSNDFSVPRLENDFEIPILHSKPSLLKVKSKLAESGALATQMTGSGSAFFGIYRTDQEAKKAVWFLRAQGLSAVFARTRNGP